MYALLRLPKHPEVGSHLRCRLGGRLQVDRLAPVLHEGMGQKPDQDKLCFSK